jgi:GGDEF domain-containing protein
VDIDNIISDGDFAQILNDKLELQIGEYIYKIGGNECIYIYKQKNVVDVNEFAKNQKKNLAHLASIAEMKNDVYTVNSTFTIYYPKYI